MSKYVVIDYEKFVSVLRDLFPKQVIHELCDTLSDNDVFIIYVDEDSLDDYLSKNPD